MMKITIEEYKLYVSFAKKILKDKTIAYDIVHDILILNWQKINVDNYKQFITYEVINNNCQVKHVEYGVKIYKNILSDIYCKGCDDNIPESEFYTYISRHGKLRRSVLCNNCRLEKRRLLYQTSEYYQNKKRQSDKKYRNNNKEKIAQINKNWRVKNRSYYLSKKKEYYQKNKKAHAAYSKNYNKTYKRKKR